MKVFLNTSVTSECDNDEFKYETVWEYLKKDLGPCIISWLATPLVLEATTKIITNTDQIIEMTFASMGE